ncbi:MAG: cytochrome c [Pseudolabrys sp.]
MQRADQGAGLWGDRRLSALRRAAGPWRKSAACGSDRGLRHFDPQRLRRASYGGSGHEKLCRHHAANTPPADKTKDAVAADHSDKGNKGKSGMPALYTEAQAQAGQQVFTHICATCHGKDLQGKSGPQIAGTAFLKKAKLLGWSVGNLRSLVVSTMPRSNPGSLKPQQYADVLAYLLAVNCYPAGHNKFPTKTTAALKHTALKPPNVKPDNGDLGTCAFHPEQKAGLGTSG